MENTIYEISFELILHAGNARYSYLSAIKAAKDNKFDQIEKFFKEGDEEFNLAHNCQTKLIAKESNGTPVELNILLVHAQDHLTMATICKDQATNFIELYKTTSSLKAQIDSLIR